MEEGVTTAASALRDQHRKELDNSARFLELNWLKQSEWHYNKIEESSRGIRDILRISKDPECKAWRTKIRKAINEMHNEIESIRTIDPEHATFAEVLEQAKIRFMKAHEKAQKACLNLQKYVKKLKDTVVPYILKIQRVVKTWQPVRMALEKDRLHVQLSEFVQSYNKRARLILTLDTTGGRAKQNKKLKQSMGASSKAPGAKKKSQHAFCTDVSKKSSKLAFVKNSFDFALELNQRLRAHRPWHLLLLLLHPESQRKRGAHNPAVKSHAATSTAGMATVDLGPVADRLLRGEECTLPVHFVKSMAPGAPADVAVAADHLLCRGQVTLHLVKQKELAAIRKHNAEVREAAMKLKNASNQQDPDVVKDQELQLRLNLLSDMYGVDTYDHVQSILQKYLSSIPRPAQHVETKTLAREYISLHQKLGNMQRDATMLPSAAIERVQSLSNEHLQAITLAVLRAVLLLLNFTDLPRSWPEGLAVLKQSGQKNILRLICDAKHHVSASVVLMAQEELSFSVDLLRLRTEHAALADALVRQLDSDPDTAPLPQLVRALERHTGEVVKSLYCWAKRCCYFALSMREATQRLIQAATREVHERASAFREARGGLPKMNPVVRKFSTFKDQLQQMEEDIKQANIDKMLDELV